MTVDVKVIRVYVWRFSVLSAGLCFRFAQKHPCIFGTLLSLSVLYIFFPLAFKLLIYSSPIMVWVYASRKNVTKAEHHEARNKKKDDQMNDGNDKCVKIDGNVLAKKRYLQSGIIDARAKNKESADYVPELQNNAHRLEKNGLNKAMKESESDVIGKAENDLNKAETAGTGDGDANGKLESDKWEKAEYEEEEQTQEEDAPGDKQKARECTKQDEYNSMDLGTSEIERDRRLESLIQKRRARKLLSMQVRNVIDIMRHPQNQIAPLVVARSTGPLNLINTLSDTDDLHMPGSAPSVLLPTRSPFDLPYDPFEERPNLTGDSSFQQEFVNADQKDYFSGGPFRQGQDGNILNASMNKETKGMARHGFSRFRSYRERGSYETLSPGASSGEHELMSRDDIAVHDTSYEEHSLKQPMKSDDVPPVHHTESENIQTIVNFEENKEKCDPESPSAGSCEEGHGTQGLVEGDSNDQVEVTKPESTRNTSTEDLTSYLHKSLTSSLQDISAKENGQEQLSPLLVSSKDLFNVHKRVHHTPAHSIASDLVVEVSEAGSPPPTLSPPDGDSSQYDGDEDRDLSSGSEDISMHVYRTEDHDTRCSDGHLNGKDGFTLGESIPEAVELEPDVLDEYEHTSQTSSDDDSSYENVVHQLNKKLKARHGRYTELSGPASAERNAVTSEKLYEQETGLNSGTSDSRELDNASGQQDHGSIEESLLPIDGQGLRRMELSETVQGVTEMRSSGDEALPDTYQAQADEEDTPPNSLLSGTTNSRDRSEAQPSVFSVPDNLSDVFQPENSIPSMSENQDLKSSTSERDIEEANMKGTEYEATLNSVASEDHNKEASVIRMLLDNQDDSLVRSVHANADEFNDLGDKSPASSTAESSHINVADDSAYSTSASSTDATYGNLEQRPAKSTEPPAEVGSHAEAHIQDADSELQTHHITETCM